MAEIRLYHTGFQEIREIDLHRGRANADFGQGFYLSDDLDFSLRWAKIRRGFDTYINTYVLETDGLAIKRFDRDREWFSYINRNRNRYPDRLADYDVIIGPIANDTLFDTLGIMTSGLLEDEQALSLLMIGPVYTQIVMKTEKALANLSFRSSEILEPDTVLRYRETMKREEKEYMKEFAVRMEEILR